MKMSRSFVCGLCGEWTDWLPRKVAIQPDFPASVRETAAICKDCDEAIKSIDECDGCVWCGGNRDYQVWDLDYPPVGGGPPTILGHPQAPICRSCWARARKEHPPEFSTGLKESVRESQNRRCDDCGMPESAHQDEFGQKLHVHHIDGDKYNNETDNLVALCARCHGSR